jgi:uncharacterized membrane protein YphA (DoxX/SURF4 family)
MFPLEADRFRGEIILIARILLVILFVISGWGKLTNYGWAVSYMATTGAFSLARLRSSWRSSRWLQPSSGTATGP